MVLENAKNLLNDEIDLEHNVFIVKTLLSARRSAIVEKDWIKVNNIDVALVSYLTTMIDVLKNNSTTIMATSDGVRNAFSSMLCEELINASTKLEQR